MLLITVTNKVTLRTTKYVFDDSYQDLFEAIGQLGAELSFDFDVQGDDDEPVFVSDDVEIEYATFDGHILVN